MKVGKPWWRGGPGAGAFIGILSWIGIVVEVADATGKWASVADDPIEQSYDGIRYPDWVMEEA